VSHRALTLNFKLQTLNFTHLVRHGARGEPATESVLTRMKQRTPSSDAPRSEDRPAGDSLRHLLQPGIDFTINHQLSNMNHFVRHDAQREAAMSRHPL
jgi:hypothetical protein